MEVASHALYRVWISMFQSKLSPNLKVPITNVELGGFELVVLGNPVTEYVPIAGYLQVSLLGPLQNVCIAMNDRLQMTIIPLAGLKQIWVMGDMMLQEFADLSGKFLNQVVCHCRIPSPDGTAISMGCAG